MSRVTLSGKTKIRNATARLLKTDPGAQPPLRTFPKQYPWKVLHGTEVAREVLPLVEGQLAAGMRPYLLTPSGFGFPSALVEDQKYAAPVSLLATWNRVRDWRKLLNDSIAEISAEIIHAHSFASGMAAVRTSTGVVYHLRETVEKRAAAAGNADENSWLARSFRVAEQFVLMHAAAVVVNNHAARLACLERGVNAANLFLIPEPVESVFLESASDRNWLVQISHSAPNAVFVLVPGLPESSAWECRDALLRWMRVLANVRREQADVTFVFLAEGAVSEALHQIASACNLLPAICVLPSEMHSKALASADIVICDQEHAARGIALEALARGRALLAGDVEEHRDITADGRGCLWFRTRDVHDIAQRATFLASNAQFRRALAAAGREHCLATRSPEVIGAQYDAVYRLAFGKRKGRDTSTPKPQLIPLQVGS